MCLGKEEWEYEFIEEKPVSSLYNNVANLNHNDRSMPMDEPGTAGNRPKTLHLVNGDSCEDNISSPPSYSAVSGDMDGRKKSVTFAPQSSQSNDSIVSQISPNAFGHSYVASNATNIPGSSYCCIL